MNRKLIITLNIFFIVGSVYLLIVDYSRVGRFQWVDPNAVEDNEELFLNPICVITMVLGIIPVLHHLHFRSTRSKQQIVTLIFRFIINPLCTLYGIFSLLIGIGFLSMLIGNAGNSGLTDFKDVVLLCLLSLIFTSYALMGFLTLYEVYQNKYST